MVRLLTILFFSLPFFSFGQQEKSPEIIWRKFLNLSKQGKLDSTKVEILFFKGAFHEIGSPKFLYYYSDTLKYKNGKYGLGKSILDLSIIFDGQSIKEWNVYYPNGKIFSKGDYKIGAYKSCHAGGPSIVGYNYKVGNWIYWYDDGSIMASGIYLNKPIEQRNSCGTDTIMISSETKKWKFYDKNGKLTKNKNQIIEMLTAHFYKTNDFINNK